MTPAMPATKSQDVAVVPPTVLSPTALVEALESLSEFQVLRFGASKKDGVSKDTVKRPFLVQVINKFIAAHMAGIVDATNAKDKSFWQVHVHKVRGDLYKDIEFSLASAPMQICVLTKRTNLEAKHSRMLVTQPKDGGSIAIDDFCGKFAAMAQGSAWGTRAEMGENDGADGVGRG